MADFGVYFQVTNSTGQTMGLMNYSLNDSCWDGPNNIPSQAQAVQVHIDDCKMWEGAEGSVNYLAIVNGQARVYSWYGTCPVGSSSNGASGPGIQSYNSGGHPLTVTIFIDANTPGWTPFPATQAIDVKSMKATLAGKKPAQESDIVQVS